MVSLHSCLLSLACVLLPLTFESFSAFANLLRFLLRQGEKQVNHKNDRGQRRHKPARFPRVRRERTFHASFQGFGPCKEFLCNKVIEKQ